MMFRKIEKLVSTDSTRSPLSTTVSTVRRLTCAPHRWWTSGSTRSARAPAAGPAGRTCSSSDTTPPGRHTRDLSQAEERIGNGAEDEAGDDRVERIVAEGETLRIGDLERGLAAESPRSVLGTLQHLRAEVGDDRVDAVRVEVQVAAGAGTDLEHPCAGGHRGEELLTQPAMDELLYRPLARVVQPRDPVVASTRAARFGDVDRRGLHPHGHRVDACRGAHEPQRAAELAWPAAQKLPAEASVARTPAPGRRSGPTRRDGSVISALGGEPTPMRDIARLDDRVVVDAVLDLLSATGRWRRWTTTFWQWTLGPASS